MLRAPSRWWGTVGVATLLVSCNATHKPTTQPGASRQPAGAVDATMVAPEPTATVADFPERLRKVRLGMPEAAVRELVGPPDATWTPQDHPGTWLRDTTQVWAYGTSDHGYPARGSVYFGPDGKVARVYDGSAAQLIGPERAVGTHVPKCLPLVSGCGCAYGCATSISAHPDGIYEVVYWGTDSATIEVRVESWCFDAATCMDAFRDQTGCHGECVPTDQFNHCHVKDGSCVP